MPPVPPASYIGSDGFEHHVSPSSRLPIEPLGRPVLARQLTATSSGQNVELTATCLRISIRCRTGDCRFTVGTSTQAGVVSATTSHFILAGERLDFSIPTGAHLGYRRDSAAAADGVLEVTELG